MRIRTVALLLAPLLLVLAVEALFQAGVWEPLARPASHAGVSVRTKRALSDPAIARLDFVTLGSSRPEYGLDHALLAAEARRHGLVHANASMPGSHWMTIGVLTRWLARRRPELQGGVIALAIDDFLYAGNGSYELGIVYPFHRPADIPLMAAHVPFARGDLASYGAWSALFAWREDLQDFLRNPTARLDSLDWHARNRTTEYILFGNAEHDGDMCAFGVDTLAACDRVDASATPQADGLRNQCARLRGMASGRDSVDAWLAQSPPPDVLARTRDQVRAKLRALTWPRAPVVVLMPTPRVWTQVLARGQHAWTLSVLQPLVDEGRIRLIDGTTFFDDDADAGCAAFFDFYHQNAAGRERFTRWLLPQLEDALYAGGDTLAR
jgi:hypothetical protein